MDENYKRSIKQAHISQAKKMRSREERKLIEENSKRRKQGRSNKGRRRRDYSAGEGADDDGDWEDFQKMRPAAQLDLEQAKREGQEREGQEREGQEREEPEPAIASDMGLVVGVAQGCARLRLESGELVEVELSHDGPRPAVGDEAGFTELDEEHLRLVSLAERRSVLSRPDPGNPNRERVLAANVDVAVIVASVVRPPLRPALIDRFLVAIGRGGAQPLVAVNKSDLLEGQAARAEVRAALAPYAAFGLEVLMTSAASGEGIEELAQRLAGLTCVFVGHSGVGKSTLLNALDPDSLRDTGGGREFDGKGRHTTTSSELVELPGGTRLIDTPGIRSLGLWKVAPAELAQYFVDFEEPARACRFRDCLHRTEPDCGVRAAVAAGEVSAQRLATYLRILETL